MFMTKTNSLMLLSMSHLLCISSTSFDIIWFGLKYSNWRKEEIQRYSDHCPVSTAYMINQFYRAFYRKSVQSMISMRPNRMAKMTALNFLIRNAEMEKLRTSSKKSFAFKVNLPLIKFG